MKLLFRCNLDPFRCLSLTAFSSSVDWKFLFPTFLELGLLNTLFLVLLIINAVMLENVTLHKSDINVEATSYGLCYELMS